MERLPPAQTHYALKPLVPLKLEFTNPEVDPPSLFERMMGFVSSVCSKIGKSLKKAKEQLKQPRNNQREAFKAQLREEVKKEERMDETVSHRLLKVRKMAEIELKNRESEPSKFKKSLHQFRTLDIQILNEVQLDDSQMPYRRKNKKPLKALKPHPSGGKEKLEVSRRSSKQVRSSWGSSIVETKDQPSTGKKSSIQKSDLFKNSSSLQKKYRTPEPTTLKGGVQMTPKSLEYSFAVPQIQTQEKIIQKPKNTPKFLGFNKPQVEEEIKEPKREGKEEPKNTEEIREMEDTKLKANTKGGDADMGNEEEKNQAKKVSSSFNIFGKKQSVSLFSKTEEKADQDYEPSPFNLGKKEDSRKEEDTVLTQDEEDLEMKSKDYNKIESPKEEKPLFSKPAKFDFKKGWSNANMNNIFSSSLQQEKRNRALGIEPEQSDSIFGKRCQSGSRFGSARVHSELPTLQSFKDIKNPFSSEVKSFPDPPTEEKRSFASAFGFVKTPPNPFHQLSKPKTGGLFSSESNDGQTNYTPFSSFKMSHSQFQDDDDLFGDTKKRYRR